MLDATSRKTASLRHFALNAFKIKGIGQMLLDKSQNPDSALLCLWILLIELHTFEQLQVIHISPRMIVLVYPNISTALFNQFMAKICHLNPGIYLVFAERCLFALVEMLYRICFDRL